MAFVKNQWWYVDKEGRRIGWLWPEDMEAILEGYYGARKWVNAFAEQFGYHRSTVDRWRNGETPIPKCVAMEINMIGTFSVRNLPLSNIEAEWLPSAEGSNANEAPNGAKESKTG